MGVVRYTNGFYRWLLVLVLPLQFLHAQQIDILLKGGHLIDPKNKIDSKIDLAIFDGKILKVASDIPSQNAKKVIDVSGLYITPGLIDIHTHVFVGPAAGFANGFSSVSPDDFTFRSGVTTVVDAGTSGAKNFHTFKENVIDRSQTRVLAFLNIFSSGFSAGTAVDQDVNDMDAQTAADTIMKYRSIIVGTRIGHYSGSSWLPFERASQAARIAGVPLLVECHLPNFSLEEQLNRMQPGDIITHTYENVSERMPVVDSEGRVRPFVLAAQKKGVLFDVGHGGAGFWFSQAIPAVAQGLLPNSFGSDLHRFSMNSGMKNMLNIMSKFLNMGLSIQDVILRATWNPARSLKRSDLGQLSEGSVADVAVLSLQQGRFGFTDSGGNRLEGKQKFEAELTIRAGKIVWDLNGIAAQNLKY